ncbi:MAG: hypothetical protein V2B18_25885 [Pseudomonadota bacterium]
MNPNEEPKAKARPHRGSVLSFIALLVGPFLAFFLFVFLMEVGLGVFRTPPNDEEMIAHFRLHQADFERLVQIYREDPHLVNMKGGLFWDMPGLSPEVRSIMDRTKVYSLRNDYTFWIPPDPYSEEAKMQRGQIASLRKADSGALEVRKVSGIYLSYSHPEVRRWNANFSQVFKGYYYTPFPPLIEGKRMKKPYGAEWVAPRLNPYPPGFGVCDCYCRRFEPQWFIRLCQSCR